MRASLLLFGLACDPRPKGYGPEDTHSVTDDTGDTGDSGEVDTDTGPDDTGPPPCAATVLSGSPEDGAEGVEIEVSPSFTLSEPDPEASIQTDIPGALSVSEDGLTLTWVVDGALSYETTYALNVKTCTGDAAWSFSTEVEPETPNELLDRSWRISLKDATITEPAALEILIGSYLVDAFVGVSAVGPGSIDLRLTTEDQRTDEPDLCLKTGEWPDVDYEDGAFSGSLEELALPLVGPVPVPLYGVTLKGRFTGADPVIEGAVMSGAVDVRYLADSLDMTPDEAVATADALHITVFACPSDGERYCVTLEVSDMNGALREEALMYIPSPNCPGCLDGEPVCE